MNSPVNSFAPRAAALLLALLLAIGGRLEEVEAQGPIGGAEPLLLVDCSSPLAARQVTLAKGVPAGSTVSVDKAGIAVHFPPCQAGDADHPGLHVTPASGATWDLSSYGHVEAIITNTGAAGINIVLHVVPTGEGYWTENNQEFIAIAPGETKDLKVIFGYNKGFKPAPGLKVASIAEIFLFLYHSTQEHTFRVDHLQAAGAAGETPST